MIDTHTHLDFPEYEKDREEVIARFFDKSKGRGKAIINVGVDLERCRKSLEIAEGHDRIFASVGLHPDFFSRGNLGDWGNWGKSFKELKELAKNKKVVAIGEIGLDYFRIGENGGSGGIREKQRKGFLAQIKIAQKLSLPVIVHCRNAFDDLYKIIKNFQFSIFNHAYRQAGFQSNPKSKIQKIRNTKYEIPDTKFVLHCYSGDKMDTEKFLELPNVYFSFSGNITFPKPRERAEKLAGAVKMIPLDKIMLDSDSPFLAPQIVRGKRNEPMYIRYIAEKISNIKDISEEEVERVTDENARKFFNI